MLLLRVEASLRIELVASFLEANADVFNWSASLGAIKVRWIWHDCYSRRVPESSQGAWWIVISSAEEAFRSAKFLTATDNFMHTNKYCHFYWFLKCMGVFFCLVSSPALFFLSPITGEAKTVEPELPCKCEAFSCVSPQNVPEEIDIVW